MTNTRFAVSWNSHQKNICDGLSFLQQHGEFVDMTLAADGHHVQVHKMIMSLVSPYIKDIITSTQCAHPVIFLHNMSYSTLQSILQYVYTGEVLVQKDDIRSFLNACKSLQIKGLDEPIHSAVDTKTNSTMDTQHKQTTEKDVTLQETSYLNEADNKQNDLTDNDWSTPTMIDDLQTTTVSTGEDLEFDNDVEIQTEIEDYSTTLLKTNVNVEDSQMIQYSVSNQGNLQIILNRFIYFLRYRRKTKDIVWNCINYNEKCPAVLVTRGNKVVKRLRAHNHTYHDKRILKSMHAGKVFSVISDAEDKSREIKLKNK